MTARLGPLSMTRTRKHHSQRLLIVSLGKDPFMLLVILLLAGPDALAHLALRLTMPMRCTSTEHTRQTLMARGLM